MIVKGRKSIKAIKIYGAFFSTNLNNIDIGNTKLPESKLQQARKLRKKLLKSTPVEGSLIKETLARLEEDDSLKVSLDRLSVEQKENMSREETLNRRRALHGLGITSFDQFLSERKLPSLQRRAAEVFQINIGLYCNQACQHCHVESSPRRLKEQMSLETVKKCLDIIKASPTITTVDITGGAPELNENFFYLASEARKLGKEVIDRCNLTVLSEPGMENLANFLAENKIQVVASLPCYSEENVDTQRGRNVFQRSIIGLQKLNELGYGEEGTDLKLDLVYNPVGPFLPPEQNALEKMYKEKLMQDFGIVFNNLFTITNMPIKRFADFLVRRGELADYMKLLTDNFNAEACGNVMCTNYISVDWEGKIYDCDFNQQLGMQLQNTTVFDITSTEDLIKKDILVANHCFGCVSGAGSSCQGATT